MLAPRRKHLAASKRRVDEEGEDEEGSVRAGVEDDSMSETSVITDADDADAEGSETSDVDIPPPSFQRMEPAVNGQSIPLLEGHPSANAAAHKSSFAAMTNDTAAMMNGLHLAENVDRVEELHFDDLAGGLQAQAGETAPVSAPAPPVISTSSNLVDKRRQEHEEYKKRRDADPSFVPNRGGFFMHDSRSAASGRNGFRPIGRGRGRGRGAFGAPPSATRYAGPFCRYYLRTQTHSLSTVNFLLHQALPMHLGHMISTKP